MDHLGWMNRSDGGLKVFEKRGWIIIEREDVVWGLDFFGGGGGGGSVSCEKNGIERWNDLWCVIRLLYGL